MAISRITVTPGVAHALTSRLPAPAIGRAHGAVRHSVSRAGPSVSLAQVVAGRRATVYAARVDATPLAQGASGEHQMVGMTSKIYAFDESRFDSAVADFLAKWPQHHPRIRLIARLPKPIIWVCDSRAHGIAHDLGDALFDFLLKIGIIAVDSRGVEIGRLEQVLNNGCDVHPTDSVMYIADGLDKAMEYGGYPKVIQIFDGSKLKQTFTEVAASTPPAELATLRATYPSWELSQDGTKIWFSRLKLEDARRTSAYEVDYARWIEGDPFAALTALLIISPNDDHIAIDDTLAKSKVRWS